MNQIYAAFGGSGFLAPALGGVACGFLDAGYAFKGVSGTSGGSIVSALIACGYGYQQIKDTCLADLPSGILDGELPSILLHQGYNDGSVLLDWLHSHTDDRTFEQAIIPLTVIATDINKSARFVFNAKNTPDVPIYQAVRASCSVPGVFAPYFIDGVKFVDGGLKDNLSIDQLPVDGTPRFAIRIIDSTGELDTSNYVDLVKQCAGAMLSANEDILIEYAKTTGAQIISVSAMPYNFLDASLSTQAKQDLFNRGYQAVKAAQLPILSY